MKNRIQFLALIMGMVLFVSCKRHKELASVPVKDFPSIENILPMQLPAEINYKGQEGNFEIMEVHQDGGFLIVKVAYSGGCNEHFFEASWDGNFMKSMPPIANVRLTHVNNDDGCRARIEKELAIDLRKLFINSSNSVMVVINGNSEGRILVSPSE